MNLQDEDDDDTSDTDDEDDHEETTKFMSLMSKANDKNSVVKINLTFDHVYFQSTSKYNFWDSSTIVRSKGMIFD